MKNSRAILWIVIGGIILVIGMWVLSGYNSLVTANVHVDGSWSQVETQYQRRFDLVPNLVNTVKGAAAFEQETFTAVTEARAQWQQAGNRTDQIQAAEEFDSALTRFIVTVENYPQLQATQAFRDLMTQLEGTENRIGTARRDYNQVVGEYNLLVKRFPSSILANLFGFDEKMFFGSTEGADQAPTVDFGT